MSVLKPSSSMPGPRLILTRMLLGHEFVYMTRYSSARELPTAAGARVSFIFCCSISILLILYNLLTSLYYNITVATYKPEESSYWPDAWTRAGDCLDATAPT